ncbi:MAG: hypothetical protein EOM12_16595 [Verrucomicrobiae bacterium]|nr:hypothetical protein [Verrucomicrobiae bacterium]
MTQDIGGNVYETCLQCQQRIHLEHSSNILIRDRDTNEVGYLHRSCVRYYAHQRNFRVLEEHIVRPERK